MKPGALVSALAVGVLLLSAPPSWGADADRVRACMSTTQAREILIAEKLVAPFRALGDASRAEGGDAVGVQLCRLGDDFVYDVTVLRRDGRVLHAIIDARKGGEVRPRGK